MAKKKKGPSGPVLFGGDSIDDLQEELNRGGGGDFDQEILTLGDGDQAEISVVAPPRGWKGYSRHWGGTGYRLCGGDGCMYCDDGDRPGKVTMIPVYVHKLFRAARKNFSANRQKKVGYKYLPLSKKPAEALIRIAKRRGGKIDRVLLIERSGSGMQDTEYDIERLDTPISKKILKGGAELNAEDKIYSMWRKEQADKSGTKKKKKKDDDLMEDSDFGFDDDDFDMPKSKKKKKSKKSRK